VYVTLKVPVVLVLRMEVYYMLFFLFLLFMAPLNKARLIEHIVIDSSPALLSGANKAPVYSQELVFHTAPNSRQRVRGNRAFTISSFSKSKRSPGVGHMQINSEKGMFISRQRLRGEGRDKKQTIKRHVLRSVPSLGVGH